MAKKVIVLIIGFLVLGRLANINKLPVFADEAIYIHWAQVIIDNPSQAFISMYDGKTPLYIWSLVLGLYPLKGFDPLLISRIVSILWGFGLVVVIKKITDEIGKNPMVSQIAVMLTLILPYGFFYSRMALIDVAMSFWIGVTYLCWLKARTDFDLVKLGIWFGMAIWTKLTAVFLIPVFLLMTIYELRNKNLNQEKQFLIKKLLMTTVIGMGMLAALKVSIYFSFLFSRGKDFTYNISELSQNLLLIIWVNTKRLVEWWIRYGILIFPPLVYLIGKERIKTHKELVKKLAIPAMVFVTPLLVTGKFITSRYFLTMSIWLIPMISVLIYQMWIRKNKIAMLTTGAAILLSLIFNILLVFYPEKAWFGIDDQVQFLTEWSAGYGNKQVVEFLKREALIGKVLVVTEGGFGTLPDGLTIYFDRSPLLKNISFEAIGYPVKDIDIKLVSKARNESAKLFLVVNSHRNAINPLDPRFVLIAEYARPLNAPKLQLYEVRY